MIRRGLAGLGLVLLAASGGVRAETQAEAYRAMGIEVGDVISGTVVPARVVPGGDAQDRQRVALATFLTGKRDRAGAVGVRLAVLEPRGGELVALYTRDLAEENAGSVGRGDLQVVDLDLDGVSEIIVTYDDLRSPVITHRVGEVIVHDGSGFVPAWSGSMRYDATKAAREVPRERRDRYQRELDIPNTVRTRGVTLFFNKTVIAVAGERLPEPKVVQETFPLRAPPEGW